MGVQIEELTGKVWDNCFQPILSKASPLLFLNFFYHVLRGFVLIGVDLRLMIIMNYRVFVFGMGFHSMK